MIRTVIRLSDPPSPDQQLIIAQWRNQQEDRVRTEPRFNYNVPCSMCGRDHLTLEVPTVFIGMQFTPDFSLIASLCPECSLCSDDAAMVIAMEQRADEVHAAELARHGGDPNGVTAELVETLFGLDPEEALAYARSMPWGTK